MKILLGVVGTFLLLAVAVLVVDFFTYKSELEKIKQAEEQCIGSGHQEGEALKRCMEKALSSLNR